MQINAARYCHENESPNNSREYIAPKIGDRNPAREINVTLCVLRSVPYRL